MPSEVLTTRATVFSISFRNFLSENPKTPHAKKFLKVLNSPNTVRRTRQLNKWESRATDEFGKIDWATVDWKAIIKQLISVLLPFVLAFLKKKPTE